MITLHGKCSWFGGPHDLGVSRSEGLALVEPDEMSDFGSGLFLAQQPKGTTGLARRLNPAAFYIACRFDYRQTPRHFLQSASVMVTNPRNGKMIHCQPVDWGPNIKTGREADLSPGALDALSLNTNDSVLVQIPEPAARPVHPAHQHREKVR